MISHERIGYAVLGITLMAALIYGWLSYDRRVLPSSSPKSEVGAGETPLPTSVELDAILSTLSMNQAFDSSLVMWIPYVDGQDHFMIERPKGWDVTDTVLPTGPEYRRVVVSYGEATLAIFPKGEFDVGTPFQEPTITSLVVDGKPATMREWNLPDGSWLALITFDDTPKNGFRMELSVLRPDEYARSALIEMAKRYKALK